jgi:hypothetical protein
LSRHGVLLTSVGVATCRCLGLSHSGALPCSACSVRRQHLRVLTKTEPFLDHFWTMCSRRLLYRLNSDGSSILEVRETTPRLREQHVSTPGLTQRYQSAESRKFNRPFPPAACAHPRSHWCPRLGAAHTPRAARTARMYLCSPRHREPPPGIGAPEAGRPTGSSRTADARGEESS